MSKIQQVEAVVLTMTPEEQEELRSWLEGLLEDRVEIVKMPGQGSLLNDNAALIADTWNKLGPAPEIDYDKL